MQISRRLESINPRILYLVLLIGVAIPIIRPLGLPIPIPPAAKEAYDAIESLPAGSMVLFTTGIAPVQEGEQNAGAMAIVRHLVSKKAKIVFSPNYPESPLYVQQWVKICESQGYVKGEDYVALPYLAGREQLFAAIGRDIKATYANVASSPLWDSIESVKDFALLVDVGPGEDARYIIAHIRQATGIKVLALTVGVNYPSTLPYYASGQLVGLLGGLPGSAQYERLSGFTGVATASMDSQSMAHLWVFILIILGNLGLVFRPKGGA